MSAPLYTYRATFLRAVDGDTIDVQVDLGFRLRLDLRVRLDGVDAPERHGSSKEAGDAAARFVGDWCASRGALIVETRRDKQEKFGRYLARVCSESGECLNEALLASGHARTYHGERRDPA